MNLLRVFDFDGMGIRAITGDDSPWFVASDIAKVLGYANPNEAVRGNCKRSRAIGDNQNNLRSSTLVIPRADVFRLIVGSNLPSAEVFQDWVFDVLLPTLCTTGRYDMADYKKLKSENDHLQKQVKHFSKLCSGGTPSKKDILESHKAIVQRELYKRCGGFYDSEMVCRDQLNAALIGLGDPDYFDGSLLPKILSGLGFGLVKKAAVGYEVWTKPSYPKELIVQRIS